MVTGIRYLMSSVLCFELSDIELFVYSYIFRMHLSKEIFDFDFLL